MPATRRTTVLALALVTLLVGAPSASAGPRDDADYTEHYFPAGDGITMLHADVLRPKGLPEDAKTPVIMTVSPYFNHAGSTIDYDPFAEGPNERFYDFLDLTRVLEDGYTYVMVDLPGTGGSGGCNDWGGDREQGAVEAAVEWAASQPWSTGRVGLMGKSYDAWTGLMGIARQPEGLAAVVSMEPVFAGYRYLYNNGVRFINSVATPAIFQAVDAKPGSPNDTPQYHTNGAPQAWCYGVNMGLQQIDDPDDPFWVERDLLLTTEGTSTPLFLTQGFLERNTKPDGAFDYWNGLSGTESRAWFGQFDHVRGWEKSDGRYDMGREVFVEEIMRFFDLHLKGLPPQVQDPAVAVQDNLGRYRGEEAWPPADATIWWNDLNLGTYADDGSNRGTGSRGGQGIWSFSQPLPHDVWLAGEPVLDVKVATETPRANLVGNVYDVAPDGRATLVSRGTFLLRDLGEQEATFELYGQDWLFREGHRIGVLVSGANAEWWTHVPTRTEVAVGSARMGLPFLTYERSAFLDGGSTPRLERYLGSAFLNVDPSTVTASEREFEVPPPLAPPPAG